MLLRYSYLYRGRPIIQVIEKIGFQLHALIFNQKESVPNRGTLSAKYWQYSPSSFFFFLCGYVSFHKFPDKIVILNVLSQCVLIKMSSSKCLNLKKNFCQLNIHHNSTDTRHGDLFYNEKILLAVHSCSPWQVFCLSFFLPTLTRNLICDRNSLQHTSRTLKKWHIAWML